MLVGSRKVFLLLLAVGLGYALGSGPFADRLADMYSFVVMSGSRERVSRGPSGTLPLLIAGFLFGQGIYLAVRQIVSKIAPARARRIERLATWEPAVQVGTRFGLHQYLEFCTTWAADDPSTRTLSLALFKIRGLGAMNDRKGTLVTTEVLQRIGAELRSAAVPEGASGLNRWLRHYFPRPLTKTFAGFPQPRYPARWSGATFALAFRELDAVQVVSISRDLASWIRRELADVGDECDLSVNAAVVLGIAGVTGRDLGTAAAKCVESARCEGLTVSLDPADVRVSAIRQMGGLEVALAAIPTGDSRIGSLSNSVGLVGERKFASVRQWASPFACVCGALLVLELTGKKPSTPSAFPWPNSLVEVQVVGPAGPSRVRLERTPLLGTSTSEWRVTDALMIQGDANDGRFDLCQFRVTVKNTSGRTHFISPNDFSAVDSDGRIFGFEPRRIIRLANSIAGQWVVSGETVTGWLELARNKSPIVGLVFEPDRRSRISLVNPLSLTVAR